jgi:hypothetical protein
VQAGVVAVTFAALLAGSNFVNPLLPVYRDVLGLSPSMLSLTFSVYVGLLVVTLFALSRPRLAVHAVQFLLGGQALTLCSDVLMVDAGELRLLTARAVAGVASGLATGASSALVVAAVGARGRAVTATGNTVGAVVGAGGGQVLVGALGSAAPAVGFISHAALMAVLLVATGVVVRRRRNLNRAALALDPAASTGQAGTPRPTGPGPSVPSVPSGLPGRLADSRQRVLGGAVGRSAVFATGALAWVGISVAVVFGATVFDELGRPLVRAVGPVLLLVASSASQLAGPALSRVAPRASGVLAIAWGVTALLVGAWLRLDGLAVAGFVLLGAGIGVAYRTALVTLTRGVSPARQGALASRYAATAYAAAAVTVAAVGRAGDMTGLVPAVAAALAVLGVLALAAVTWAPRLRDTVDAVRSVQAAAVTSRR